MQRENAPKQEGIRGDEEGGRGMVVEMRYTGVVKNSLPCHYGAYDAYMKAWS